MKHCILCKYRDDNDDTVNLIILSSKEDMYATLESMENTHVFYRGRLDNISYPL